MLGRERREKNRCMSEDGLNSVFSGRRKIKVQTSARRL